MTPEDRIGLSMRSCCSAEARTGVDPARCAGERSVEGTAIEADHEGGEIVFPAVDGVLESEG